MKFLEKLIKFSTSIPVTFKSLQKSIACSEDQTHDLLDMKQLRQLWCH